MPVNGISTLPTPIKVPTRTLRVRSIDRCALSMHNNIAKLPALAHIKRCQKECLPATIQTSAEATAAASMTSAGRDDWRTSSRSS